MAKVAACHSVHVMNTVGAIPFALESSAPNDIISIIVTIIVIPLPSIQCFSISDKIRNAIIIIIITGGILYLKQYSRRLVQFKIAITPLQSQQNRFTLRSQ